MEFQKAIEEIKTSISEKRINFLIVPVLLRPTFQL